MMTPTVRVLPCGALLAGMLPALPHPAAAQERHTMADHRAAGRAEWAVAAGPAAATGPVIERRGNPLRSGVVGMAAGTAVGAAVGALACPFYEPCATRSGFVGSWLGVPAGVHAAYGGTGVTPLIWASAVSVVAGRVGAATLDRSPWAYLVTVPPVQLGASLLMEEAALRLATNRGAAGEGRGARGMVAVSPGVVTFFNSAYHDTYLVTAAFPGPRDLPLEVGVELMPELTRRGDDHRVYWVGVHDAAPDRAGLYSGARVGYLDTPTHDGFMADVHSGLRAGYPGVGLRVEPALVYLREPEYEGFGVRITVGLTLGWN